MPSNSGGHWQTKQLTPHDIRSKPIFSPSDMLNSNPVTCSSRGLLFFNDEQHHQNTVDMVKVKDAECINEVMHSNFNRERDANLQLRSFHVNDLYKNLAEDEESLRQVGVHRRLDSENTGYEVISIEKHLKSPAETENSRQVHAANVENDLQSLTSHTMISQQKRLNRTKPVSKCNNFQNDLEQVNKNSQPGNTSCEMDQLVYDKQVRPNSSQQEQICQQYELKESKKVLDGWNKVEEMKKNSKLCFPFCEIFVVFGLNHSKFNNDDIVSYEILSSYPNLEKNPEVAEQNKFVGNLQMICFPEVHLSIEKFNHLSDMDALCRPHFFHFISTDDFAEHRYITSIHFREILLCDKGAFTIPKALCVASRIPIFTLQKQFLFQIFQKVVLTNNSVSTKAYKQAMSTYEGFLDQDNLELSGIEFHNYVCKYMNDIIMCTESRTNKNRSQSPQKQTPNQNNAIQSRTKRQQRDQSQMTLVDFTPVLELYITIFSKHLYHNPACTRDIQIVIQSDSTESTREMSRYGTNQSQLIFGTAQKAKYPPDKSNQLQNQSKNAKYLPLFNFRNHKPFGFQLENYQFDLLLQKVKPEKLIQLFTALLLERKVVLIKKEIGDIALIMQGLITLLNPFSWNFAIITYLTRDYIDLIDAPFPFLIGISAETWEHVNTIKEFPDDIIIFDLETQERKFIPKFDFPELPKPYADDLLKGLKDVMEKKDRKFESLKAQQKNTSKNTLSEYFNEQYWADAQLSVKQLFFNFLLLTVNNYIQFYKTVDDYLFNESNNILASDDFFDFEGYLKFQEERSARHMDNNIEFIKSLVSTQAFHKFIEQSCLTRKDLVDNQAVFFETSIEILLEESMKNLKDAQQQMIDEAKHNLNTPVRIRFNGILSKYVKGIKNLECQEFEKRRQAGLLSPCSKNINLQEMSDQDQIDMFIMKNVFRRPDLDNESNQLSMLTQINTKMIFEEMPQIGYDQAENAWRELNTRKDTILQTPIAKQSQQSHQLNKLSKRESAYSAFLNTDNQVKDLTQSKILLDEKPLNEHQFENKIPNQVKSACNSRALICHAEENDQTLSKNQASFVQSREIEHRSVIKVKQAVRIERQNTENDLLNKVTKTETKEKGTQDKLHAIKHSKGTLQQISMTKSGKHLRKHHKDDVQSIGRVMKRIAELQRVSSGEQINKGKLESTRQTLKTAQVTSSATSSSLALQTQVNFTKQSPNQTLTSVRSTDSGQCINNQLLKKMSLVRNQKKLNQTTSFQDKVRQARTKGSIQFRHDKQQSSGSLNIIDLQDDTIRVYQHSLRKQNKNQPANAFVKQIIDQNVRDKKQQKRSLTRETITSNQVFSTFEKEPQSAVFQNQGQIKLLSGVSQKEPRSAATPNSYENQSSSMANTKNGTSNSLIKVGHRKFKGIYMYNPDIVQKAQSTIQKIKEKVNSQIIKGNLYQSSSEPQAHEKPNQQNYKPLAKPSEKIKNPYLIKDNDFQDDEAKNFQELKQNQKIESQPQYKEKRATQLRLEEILRPSNPKSCLSGGPAIRKSSKSSNFSYLPKKFEHSEDTTLRQVEQREFIIMQHATPETKQGRSFLESPGNEHEFDEQFHLKMEGVNNKYHGFHQNEVIAPAKNYLRENHAKYLQADHQLMQNDGQARDSCGLQLQQDLPPLADVLFNDNDLRHGDQSIHLSGEQAILNVNTDASMACLQEGLDQFDSISKQTNTYMLHAKIKFKAPEDLVMPESIGTQPTASNQVKKARTYGFSKRGNNICSSDSEPTMQADGLCDNDNNNNSMQLEQQEVKKISLQSIVTKRPTHLDSAIE